MFQGALVHCFKKLGVYKKHCATYKTVQPDESKSRWNEEQERERGEEEEEEEVSRRCKNTWSSRGLISPERFCSPAY